MLRAAGNIDSPLAECVEELWQSKMEIVSTTNYASDLGQMISAPLTEISGRPTYLPAPRLTNEKNSNTLFGFGIWSVWISSDHGLLACSRTTHNMILAPFQPTPGESEEDPGLILYNDHLDAEVLVHDGGPQMSPYRDANRHFEDLCARGHCERGCEGAMVHNSSMPWVIARCHSLVPEEESNIGAARSHGEHLSTALGLRRTGGEIVSVNHRRTFQSLRSLMEEIAIAGMQSP